MGNHPEYTHDNRVDGNTKYGVALNSFPRRNMVGVSYGGSTLSGSRGIQSHNSTARTTAYYSYGQRLVVMSMGIG